MASLSYYTSERVIHDGIVEEARSGVQSLYRSWKSQQKIRPFVIVWPAEEIVWNGISTSRPVAFDAPIDESKRKDFLREVQRKAAAYAILLWVQKEKAVVGVLESIHGTKSWHLPIIDHGNVKVLGKPEEKTDVDHLGLNWQELLDSTRDTGHLSEPRRS